MPLGRLAEGVFVAERQFRLPGSPYEELASIIVAYGTRDDASRTGDVGKLDSVHQSSVSRTNAFLTEIGVLQGETKKLITRRGRALALALARKDREAIRSNWREVVGSTEFLQNVVSAVKLREGMLTQTVQAYIAHAAGQPRNKPVMTGAGAIVEILKTAGLLHEEAGELVATFDEAPEPAEPGLPKGPEVQEAQVSATVEASPSAPAGQAPTVSIQIHIRCTADEVEDLAPKLKALIARLS
jgi:hypothetical protein